LLLLQVKAGTVHEFKRLIVVKITQYLFTIENGGLFFFFFLFTALWQLCQHCSRLVSMRPGACTSYLCPVVLG
jgi:hypothetical protein